MIPAELTDQEFEEENTNGAGPSDADALDDLQSRIDDLGNRIRGTIPEGYDLHSLLVEYRLDVVEDVFDITADHEALVRLSGPVAVPGSTPPPAFETKEGSAFDLEGVEVAQKKHRLRTVLRVLLMLIVVAALVAAAVAVAVV